MPIDFPSNIAETVLRSVARRPVVILERIARGAGATNWYVVKDRTELDLVVRELRPGSRVSFYFDDRIARRRYSAEVHRGILDIIRETGECAVGQPEPDGVHLDMEYVGTAEDLSEYTATLGTHSTVYFGPFPQADDDGRSAITVVLPDQDGIVRAHPH